MSSKALAPLSLLLIGLLSPLAAGDNDPPEVRRLREENLKLREEALKLKEQLLREQQRMVDLLKQVEETRRQLVAARLVEETLRQRSEQLTVRLRDLEAEVARLKVRGEPGVAPKPGERNFPDNLIEGTVVEIEKGSGLVRLSLGSDAGLKRGHHLQLFRLDRVPEKSRYLGVLEVLEVRERESVARPVGRLPLPVQVNDKVTSRLQGLK